MCKIATTQNVGYKIGTYQEDLCMLDSMRALVCRMSTQGDHSDTEVWEGGHSQNILGTQRG